MIVSAVIGLGRALGLRTIAEGIEERKQLELLADGGCRLGQGYLWSKPVPASEAAQWASSTARLMHAGATGLLTTPVQGREVAASRLPSALPPRSARDATG